MKIILDEQLPETLINDALAPREVSHLRHRGWQGLANGNLLQAAEAEGFETFLTADKNIPHQQNIAGWAFVMIVLDVHPTNPGNLLACAKDILVLLPSVQAGRVYILEGSHSERRK